ncbi:hypothetical protein B0H10DRAFT_126285 [Mycena sp. CBHHK59/15]|nr:hypothetical protein B0H10DRAFT_126285 [Mycena sp. CBHHK59/15]
MTVIVDDHDHRIVYDPVGLWIPEGGSLEFMATTTSSNTTGCTGNFTFLGTSITIYGSVGPGNGSSMSFRIDKSSGSYSAPALNNAIHHQTFWTSPVLPMGLHNLVITQASSASHPLFFSTT